MQFVATQKNTRQSPRKIRLVASQVRSLPLEKMIDQLAVVERKASLVLLKVLKQAIANAQNNHGVSFDRLKLKELVVMEGPRYKRWRAVSRGRAHSIIKRTSHVRVILVTKQEEKKSVDQVAASTKKQDASKKSEEQKSSASKKSEKKVAAPTKKAASATSTSTKKASSKKSAAKTTTKKTTKKA